MKVNVYIGKSKVVHVVPQDYPGDKVPKVWGGVELRTQCGKPGPFITANVEEATCKECLGRT